MADDRKRCVTDGCKGTLPINDDHAKCSVCRKSKPPVMMSRSERVRVKASIDEAIADRKKWVDLPITDPVARRMNPSIAWMFQ